MKISINNIGESLSKIVNDYSEELKISASNKLIETADEILDYVVRNCPRSSQSDNHLADSFIKTTYGEGINKIIYISSKNKYQIVHLIELGFRHKSGKHVPARPFLRPAYEIFTPKMIEDIKNIIRGKK